MSWNKQHIPQSASLQIPSQTWKMSPSFTPKTLIFLIRKIKTKRKELQMDFKHSGELGGVMADGYFSCTRVKIISTPQYPGLLRTCENLSRKSCSMILKAQSCSRWYWGLGGTNKKISAAGGYQSQEHLEGEGFLLTRLCRDWGLSVSPSQRKLSAIFSSTLAENRNELNHLRAIK